MPEAASWEPSCQPKSVNIEEKIKFSLECNLQITLEGQLSRNPLMLENGLMVVRYSGIVKE